MADAVDQLKEDLTDIERLGSDAVRAAIKRLSGFIGDSMSDAAEKGRGATSDFIKDAENQIRNLAHPLQSIFGDQKLGEGWLDSARENLNSVKEMITASASQVKFGIDFSDLKTDGLHVVDEIEKGLNDIRLTDVAGVLLGPLSDAFEQVAGPMDRFQKKFTELEGPAASLFSAFGTDADSAKQGLGGLDDKLVGYRQSITEASTATHLGVTEMSRGFQELARQGIDPEQLQLMDKMAIGTRGVTEEFDRLSAMTLISKATMQTMGEVGGIVARGMNELGLSGDQAIQMFGTLKEAQTGSHLSFERVESDVMRGSDSLKLFGNNVDGAAALYQSFVNTLGRGRAGLAGELVQTMTSGLASMSDGFRAFLGMTGQVGSGAGGAVGGMLRVEQAMASGNIEGIISDLGTTITRLTGAPLLTRQTAIDTGQEQQFYMQRQVLQQSLGVGDREQATKILEMMGSGQKVSVDNLRAGSEQALKGVVDAGEATISRQTTAVEQVANAMETLSNEALTDMRSSVMGANDALTKLVGDGLMKAQGFFRTTGGGSQVAMPGEQQNLVDGQAMMEENRRLPMPRLGQAQMLNEGLGAFMPTEEVMRANQMTPTNITSEDLMKQRLGTPTLAPMPTLPMNQRPPLEFNMDTMRGASDTLRREGSTPPTTGGPSASNQPISIAPLTINVAVNPDGSFRAYFLDEAGKQTESMMRELSSTESSGSRSSTSSKLRYLA